MTDKPILFSASMIRALLDGRKTQTRRVLKPNAVAKSNGCSHLRLDVLDGSLWWWDGEHDLAGASQSYPFTPGDRLWVRESWRPSVSAVDPWHVAVLYTTDSTMKHWNWSSDADFGDWNMPKQAAKGSVPSIHMPRWASRMTLVVTDVRVQRLQDISEEDAFAEGVFESDVNMYPELGTARHHFQDLWDSLNAKRGFGWDVNPWITATTFTVHQCNIDQMEAA